MKKQPKMLAVVVFIMIRLNLVSERDSKRSFNRLGYSDPSSMGNFSSMS